MFIKNNLCKRNKMRGTFYTDRLELGKVSWWTGCTAPLYESIGLTVIHYTVSWKSTATHWKDILSYLLQRQWWFNTNIFVENQTSLTVIVPRFVGKAKKHSMGDILAIFQFGNFKFGMNLNCHKTNFFNIWMILKWLRIYWMTFKLF